MEKLGIYTLFTGKFIKNFNNYINNINNLKTNFKIELHIITDNIDFFKNQNIINQNINLNIHYSDNFNDKILSICKYNLYLKYLSNENYILLCDSNVEVLNIDNVDFEKINIDSKYHEKFILGSNELINDLLKNITNSINVDFCYRNVYSDLIYINGYIDKNPEKINFVLDIINVFNRRKQMAIYYIATGKYNTAFDGFIKNIEEFYPDCDKTIILMSDQLRDYDGKIINGCKIEFHEICGYPWPIVTLFKMDYILQYKGDYDYCCYCNADLVFNENFNKYENVDLTKLTCTKHNWMDDNFTALPLADDMPNSTSYIGDRIYNYVNGGFFIGKADIFYKMCQDIIIMHNIDLDNNIIPKWHDETYLNKWCILNPQLVKNEKRILVPCTPNEECPFYIDYKACEKPKFGE